MEGFAQKVGDYVKERSPDLANVVTKAYVPEQGMCSHYNVLFHPEETICKRESNNQKISILLNRFIIR